MSDMFCKKCGEYLFAAFGGKREECNCKEFTVFNEDGDEYEIHAKCEEDAALKYAEKSNVEGDYYLMNNTVEIEINGSRYCIGAEPDVHYSCKAL